jgi:putative endonuclease
VSVLARFTAWWRGLRNRSHRDPLGPAGERAAARYLRRKHYRVLERNLKIAGGELDLVMLHPDRRTIVVVEVKARRVTEGQRAAPPPEAQLHAHKRRQLLRLTEALIRKRAWIDRPVRIDLVAVDMPARGRPIVRHHESAVTLNDRA